MSVDNYNSRVAVTLGYELPVKIAEMSYIESVEDPSMLVRIFKLFFVASLGHPFIKNCCYIDAARSKPGY